MSFNRIFDQNMAVRTLQSAFRKERIAHAYLFVGPSGVGRKLTAVVFAKLLNCENPRGDNPCGNCPNCRLIAEGKHPDVQIIVPTKRSSTITVEQIEALLPFAYMRPMKGTHKVFVFSEADRLGVGTANKLLKTLEEPPPFTLFVLVTERPESLLPTVSSRCQPIKFGRLRAESVERILVSDFGVEADRAALAAKLADGQVTRAMGFAQPDRLNAVVGIVESLESCTSRLDAAEKLLAFLGEQQAALQEQAESKITFGVQEVTAEMKSALEDLRKSFIDRHYRDLLNDCLGLLLTIYRDILVLKETNAEELVINRNRLDMLHKQARAISLSAIMKNIEEIERASEYCAHYVGEDRVFANLVLGLR